MKYFVALKYPGNGSLGYNVEAGNEELAKLSVLRKLPSELVDPDFLKCITVVPENRIDMDNLN